MYAVITTGGKQYRVAPGDVLRIEKLEAGEGDAIEFDKVLLVANDADVRIGRPYVEGSTVSARVRGQGRGKKIEIIKFRRRKHHMKRQGHRQYYTEVEITGING